MLHDPAYDMLVFSSEDFLSLTPFEIHVSLQCGKVSEWTVHLRCTPSTAYSEKLEIPE
jgi:hypothetical protein